MVSFVVSIIINTTLSLNLLVALQSPNGAVDAFALSSPSSSTTRRRPPPLLEYQTSWEYNSNESKNKKKRSSILSITDIAYIIDGGAATNQQQEQRQSNDDDSKAVTIVLAIASNDGAIRYLSYNTTRVTANTDSSSENTTPVITETKGMMIHNKNSNKPIFSVDSIPVVAKNSSQVPEVPAWSDNCYILSGSYDRTATLSRIAFLNGIGNKNQISATSDPTPSTSTFSSSWTLPEHTGWVRKVKLVQYNAVTNDIITNNQMNNFNRFQYRKSISNDVNDHGKFTGDRKENVVINFCLSIGCNLVNVWVPATADNETDDVVGSGTEPESRQNPQEEESPLVSAAAVSTSHRLARLDGGPSPNDTEEFRRHDIVSMEVLVLKRRKLRNDVDRDEKDNSIIVAGLVDGTLRAWKGRWNYWLQRRNDNGDYVYDSTGSCCNNLSSNICSVGEEGQTGSQGEMNDGSYDDKPFASIHAHQDRVIGMHACYYDQGNRGDEDDATSYVGTFISVARNGCWGLWHILPAEEGNEGNDNANGFDLLSNGSIFGTDDGNDDEQRVCSSAVACFGTQVVLYAGTTNGKIYSVTIVKEETTSSSKTLVWNEDQEFNHEAAGATAITSLHWINAPELQDCDHAGSLLAGNSDGLLRCFKAVE